MICALALGALCMLGGVLVWALAFVLVIRFLWGVR